MRQATISKRLFGAVSLAAATCLSINSGSAHAQVRLHSASEQEETAQLTIELEKARVAHVAALDAHRAYLEEALLRERRLLVQRELAERDAVLTLALSANGSAADRKKLLSDQIGAEWRELVGTVPDDAVYRRIAEGSRQASSFEIERIGLQRNLATLIAVFESKGGKGSYCKSNGQGDVSFSSLGDTPQAMAMVDVCEELARNAQQIQGIYQRAGAASALLGDPDATAGGLMGTALDDTKEVTTLIEAQNALIKTVKGQVKDLDAYYQCQLGRTTAAQELRADAAAVQGALDKLAKGDPAEVFNKETFQRTWSTLVTQKVDPDCSKPAPTPNPAAQPNAPSSMDILSIVARLDRYAAGDALLALARESALDVQGSALGEALKGLAAGASDKPDSVTAKRAMAALRVFGSFDQVYRGSRGRLPDTAGVLVALTDVRMRQATAKLEADRLAELDRLNKLRLQALRQRAVLLADASGQLASSSDAALISALRRYAESVNRGAIPATVATNDMLKGRYLPWLDREKAVVEAAYGTLMPAAAQLQAYGKGGISPDTLAQLLQVLSLGGIAVK